MYLMLILMLALGPYRFICVLCLIIVEDAGLINLHNIKFPKCLTSRGFRENWVKPPVPTKNCVCLENIWNLRESRTRFSKTT